MGTHPFRGLCANRPGCVRVWLTSSGMGKVMKRISAVIFTAILLFGCGGGIGIREYDNRASPTTPAPETTDLRSASTPAPGMWRNDDVETLPITYKRGNLYVGTDISTSRPLPPVPRRPGFSYGTVNDGEGRESVTLAMMTYADIGEFKGFAGLEVFTSPPTVHVNRSASDYHKGRVIRAVQLINEALPPAWHVRIGSEAPDLSPTVPDGKIYVDFAPASDWKDPHPTPPWSVGIAQHFLFPNR